MAVLCAGGRRAAQRGAGRREAASCGRRSPGGCAAGHCCPRSGLLVSAESTAAPERVRLRLFQRARKSRPGTAWSPPPPPEGGRFPRRLPPTPTLSRGAFLNVSGVSFVTPSRFSPNKMTSSRHPFRGPQGGEAQEGAAGPLRRRPPGARDTVLVLRARGTLGGQRVSAPAEARVLVGAGAGGRGRGLHDAAPRRAGKR